MKRLIIAYHSQSGTCTQLSLAALRGAQREVGIQVERHRAWDIGAADLRAGDGLLCIAAENSGTLSGGMKDFLDRIFYPAIDRGLVLPYGVLISAGNDGRGALAQLQRVLSGVPFTPAAEPLILRGEVCEEHTSKAQELGEGLATGLVMGIF
ncbi:MAG: flavodoxin [Halioglobus sp.]